MRIRVRVLRFSKEQPAAIRAAARVWPIVAMRTPPATFCAYVYPLCYPESVSAGHHALYVTQDHAKSGDPDVGVTSGTRAVRGLSRP
ncbi:hypothetical protein GCM10009642_09250 [Nocardiopsis metallicus]